MIKILRANLGLSDFSGVSNSWFGSGCMVGEVNKSFKSDRGNNCADFGGSRAKAKMNSIQHETCKCVSVGMRCIAQHTDHFCYVIV